MDRTEAHLRDFLRLIGSLPGGEAVEDGHGTLRVTTGIGWPMLNGGIGQPNAEAVRALQDAGAPFFWWVLDGEHDEALAAAGLTRFDDAAPWEECEIAALEDQPVPPGIRLEEVDGEAAHRAWAATLREIYEFPEAGEKGWLEPARRCGWTGLPWRQWIAFEGDRPVGVTLLAEGGGIAGLFGVGVVEDRRCAGIGRLVTVAPLKQATAPLAGFFSTPDGSRLYRKLGFRPRGALTRWLWLPPDSAMVAAHAAAARGRAAD